MRREYLYRKAQQDRLRAVEEKKLKLKTALDGGVLLLHLRFWYQQNFTVCVPPQETAWFRRSSEEKLCSCSSCWSSTTEELKVGQNQNQQKTVSQNQNQLSLSDQGSVLTWTMSTGGPEWRILR